uniref:Sodium/hydrogen exchanger n=1 Tax=Denticeps clupeoides TaxID=299321 RepID=A0AAY4DP77_9TELE
MPFATCLFLLCAVVPVCDAAAGEEDIWGVSNSSSQNTEGQEQNNSGLPIVTFRWNHVQTPFLVSVWIIVGCLAKMVFELNHRVTNIFPESGLLILIGFVLGGIVWGADKKATFALQPTTFFYYLLPQIILDAGYCMPNKLFFSNMGAILVYAVIGTCWNAGAVGISLWGCYEGGAMGHLEIGFLQFLLFGSLLSAVDPVAVIAVFEEVHVNEVLFILVFGESLLNDGVTVVLYNVCDAFVSLGAAKINAAEIIKGIISFFVVAFGGALVGVIFAIILCLLTRCTKNIQIIEAGFIFVISYLSYLTAEMLSLSAIMAITFCGVCSQKYINVNMDERSVNTVRYAMKVFANGSETMIFVFLGISAIDPAIWVWNTGFILLTLLFVFVYRIMGVFFLTWFLNKTRLVPVETIEQVIMSYGGLRGGVAYALATVLDPVKIKEKNLMLCTTFLVIYFTVVLQGVTMKPLVKWLKVKRSAQSELKLIEKLNNRTFEHTLCAVEDICGRIGDNWWIRGWNRFEQKWICRYLMKPSARKSQDYLFGVFHQLNLEDAVNYVNNDEPFNLRNEIKKPKLKRNCTKFSAGLLAICFLLKTHYFPCLLPQHRHKYSRSHFSINQSEDEVQEIFQRTMRSRLESFKSAKMGVAPAKKISKHPQKDRQQKVRGSRLHPQGSVTVEMKARFVSISPLHVHAFLYTTAGIVNRAFMPEMDTPPTMRTPPWLSQAETDGSVAPSQRAQRSLPWSPSNIRRLAPLRISNRSTDSFIMADVVKPPENPEDRNSRRDET